MELHPDVNDLTVAELNRCLTIMASSPYALCATNPIGLPEETKRNIVSDLLRAKGPNRTLEQALATAAIVLMPSLVAEYGELVKKNISEIDSLFWVHAKGELLAQETETTLNALHKMLNIFGRTHDEFTTATAEQGLNFDFLENNVRNFCQLSLALQNVFKLRGFLKTSQAILQDLGPHASKDDYEGSIEALKHMGATAEQIEYAKRIAPAHFSH